MKKRCNIMKTTLIPLFSPRSIAIIGASSVPGRPGYLYTTELLRTGYAGSIYPINPKGGKIGDIEILKNLDDVKEPIDLALIAVNKKLVLDAVQDCAQHGAKIGIIFSAGFGEMGQEGKVLEKKIVETAKQYQMRLVGPNCFGIFSAPSRVNLTSMFVPAGRIALISQSGNVATSLWYDAEHYLNTGFSRVICYGNQADIAVHEYIDFCADDPESDVIVLYFEGLRSGSGLDFIRSASRAAKKKPIVILKGGSTATGRRAATSHTGSLAGNDALYQAAFEKAGIVQVKSLDDLLPTAQAMMLCPPMCGKNLGVSGSGGGHMILSADAADAAGFVLPPFTDACNHRIDELFYDFAPKGNPCEQAATWESNLQVWGDAADAILGEPHINGMFTFGNLGGDTPDLVTNGTNWSQAMEHMVEVKNRHNKPVIAYSLSARGPFPTNEILRSGGIPVFDSIQVAMRAMRGLWEAYKYRHRLDEIPEIVPPVMERPPEFAAAEKRVKRNLLETEAYRLLERNEISVIPYKMATSADEAARAAEQLGFPVVMKIVSPDIIHKSDVGGVWIGIQSREEARAAFDAIVENGKAYVPNADIQGVLVSKQTTGAEIIAGLIRDVQFGTVLMVGMGGVFVEILKDVDFIILPATREEIRRKLMGLKAFPLLNGARGREKCDVDALVELLYQVSVFAQRYSGIMELDLNPIFVSSKSACVADARIILEENSEVGSSRR